MKKLINYYKMKLKILNNKYLIHFFLVQFLKFSFYIFLIISFKLILNLISNIYLKILKKIKSDFILLNLMM